MLHPIRTFRWYHDNACVAIAQKILAGVAVTAVSLSCYSHGETTCGQEDSPRAPLRGSVMVRSNGVTSPGAGSLVFVELCGLYSENPNPAKGHPNYRYVTLADSAGNFQVDVPKGTVGLHTLLEGYTYGFTRVDDSAAFAVNVVNAEALGPRVPPTVNRFVVSKADAAPGEALTFSLDVQPAGTDPLSEEVLLAEPASGFARAFDPPSRGKPGRSYPGGTWTATIAAPQPGKYTYYAQATSEQCAVSPRLRVEVNVR